MADGSNPGITNSLLYVATNIAVWAIVSGTIEILLFDGEWQNGTAMGIVDGSVYGVSMLYLRQRND